MNYEITYSSYAVGQMFEKKGVNPFEEPIIYTVKEIRRDNIKRNWLHLESEHEHIYLSDTDLFVNFVKIRNK